MAEDAAAAANDAEQRKIWHTHCYHVPKPWFGAGPAPLVCCHCGHHKQEHGPHAP